MSEQSGIPQEWRTAAEETAKALSIARAIERKQFPEGDAPAGLLAALVVSVALARVRDGSLAICDNLGGDELLLIERLAGIETELFRLTNVIGDTVAARAYNATGKGRGNGGK